MQMLRISPTNMNSLLGYANSCGAQFTATKQIHLIDFYDWLDCHAMLGDNVQYVKDFITPKRRSYYLNLRHRAKEFINRSKTGISDIDYFILHPDILVELLEGYAVFVRDLEVIQKKLLQKYVKLNTSTMPFLIVPFSYGLNRLMNFHMQLTLTGKPTDTITGNKGLLNDGCNRLEKKYILIKGLSLGTYSCKIEHEDREILKRNLPKDWRLYYEDLNSDGTRREMITGNKEGVKLNCILDVYTQYKYVGYAQLGMGQKVFLINYPFLQREMTLKLESCELNNPTFYSTDDTQLDLFIDTVNNIAK